jgi:FemAB-related protein (PEP-CTERM system-associated)
MRVEYLGADGDASRWDGFVEPRASAVTDLFAWRHVVRETYGIASHFLIATDGTDVHGALGLYEVRHPMFGHYLSTAVFGTDGGLHATSAPAHEALIAEAKALAARLRVAYLAIRTRDAALPGFDTDTRYRTAIIALEGSADAAFKALPVKTRNQVRRGLKEGFTISAGHDQRAAFVDVFHRHMRDLGSPAHSPRYYDAIERYVGDRAEFLVVRDGATLVGGALVFRVNGTVTNHHTVTLRQFNRRCPNYLLYWHMLESGYQRGCRAFDMGRSEADSTQLKFKENWSPRVVPLFYNYHLVRAHQRPQLNPRNPKFRAAVAVWQRLPVAVTRVIGPRLISGLA